jgi:hypothetical protein
MKWAASQPESTLSLNDAFLEMDQAAYSIGDSHIVSDPWHGNVVRTNLIPILETVCEATDNELAFVFDQRFGTDENEWRELNVYDTMKMIIAQATSRIMLGLPHCELPFVLPSQNR